MRLIKKILSALLSATSVQPFARPAPPASAEVMADHERAIKEIEYDHATVVRPEMLARYDGPRTPITSELLAQLRASKKWRNGCITAMEDTRAFVEERTK